MGSLFSQNKNNDLCQSATESVNKLFCVFFCSDTTVTDVSNNIKDLLGYYPQEIIGKNIFSCLPGLLYNLNSYDNLKKCYSENSLLEPKQSCDLDSIPYTRTESTKSLLLKKDFACNYKHKSIHIVQITVKSDKYITCSVEMMFYRYNHSKIILSPYLIDKNCIQNLEPDNLAICMKLYNTNTFKNSFDVDAMSDKFLAILDTVNKMLYNFPYFKLVLNCGNVIKIIFKYHATERHETTAKKISLIQAQQESFVLQNIFYKILRQCALIFKTVRLIDTNFRCVLCYGLVDFEYHNGIILFGAHIKSELDFLSTIKQDTNIDFVCSEKFLAEWIRVNELDREFFDSSEFKSDYKKMARCQITKDNTKIYYGLCNFNLMLSYCS